MRMNISVPDALKDRMDAVREDVNWSALACRAFEQKLGEIAASKARKNMADVIDRLRASKQKHSSEAAEQGRKAGSEWARDQAEYAELQRLDVDRQSAQPVITSDEEAVDLARAVACVVTADQAYGRSWRLAEEFWEEVLGDESRSLVSQPDYVRGFVEGALEVWREVADKV